MVRRVSTNTYRGGRREEQGTSKKISNKQRGKREGGARKEEAGRGKRDAIAAIPASQHKAWTSQREVDFLTALGRRTR